MANRNLTIGRIVHYLDREAVMAKGEAAEPMAAIITRVQLNERVDLGLFHPELGFQIRRDVDYGEHVGGWRWPPRVDFAEKQAQVEPEKAAQDVKPPKPAAKKKNGADKTAAAAAK